MRTARARFLNGLILLLLLGSMGCSERRVLVVGLDGASWRAIDPLIEAGLLPNIGDLVRRGARAELDCVPADPATACFCPPVWTSIATGTSKSSHRIRGFFTPSSDRESQAIWNVAAQRGVRVVTSSWRGTWPPEPGIDYVFTEPGLDLMGEIFWDAWNPSDHPGLTSPEPLFQPPDVFESLGLLPPPSERPPTWSVYARDRVAMESLLQLERGRPYEQWWEREAELTMILIHGPDKVAHLLWGLYQQEMFGPFDSEGYVEAARQWDGPVQGPAPFAWGVMAGPYLEADAWLGRLFAQRDYDYVVLVSDHGMTRNPRPGLWGQHDVPSTEGHAGIFSVTGPGVRAGASLGTMSVLDVAPTLAYVLGLPVARDLEGGVRADAFRAGWLELLPPDASTVATWEDASPP